jgi:hypothetical protein
MQIKFGYSHPRRKSILTASIVDGVSKHVLPDNLSFTFLTTAC